MTGSEVIQAMCGDKVKVCIADVTPCYQPLSNSICMSEIHLKSETIESVAIAAHESAHAIQHAQGYWLMRLRIIMAKLFFVAFINTIFLAVALATVISGSNEMFIVLFLFCLIRVASSVVNYYLEKDASKLAMAWLFERTNAEQMKIISEFYKESLKTYRWQL